VKQEFKPEKRRPEGLMLAGMSALGMVMTVRSMLMGLGLVSAIR